MGGVIVTHECPHIKQFTVNSINPNNLNVINQETLVTPEKSPLV